MDQITDYSKSNDSTEKSSSRRNYTTRENILQKNHKPVDVKHLEQQYMIELIKKNY